MTLVTQAIRGLIQGVSQSPPRRRLAQHGGEQINMLSHRSRGLWKRPPLDHVAKLTSGTLSGAFVDIIAKDSDERYILVAYSDSLRVFDLDTGVEKIVRTPDGTGYLTGSNYQIVTAGDRAYFLNRDQEVSAKVDTYSTPEQPEALVVVQEADFGTRFTVIIEGTPLGFTTRDPEDPTARVEISTDYVARRLTDIINDELPAFTATQYGSTIHLIRDSGENFELDTHDGLADQGLLAIKGKVPAVADLPKKAPPSFVVRVQGDPTTDKDDSWFQYQALDGSSGSGSWKEVARPGSRKGFDSSTLPHEMIFDDALKSVAARTPGDPSVVVLDYSHEWDGMDDPGGDGTGGTNDHTVREDAHVLSISLSSSVAGSGRTIDTFYDVDARGMDPGTVVNVVVKKNSVEVGRKSYVAGRAYQNERISFTGAAGDGVTMEMEYLDGAGTPVTDFRKAYLTAGGSGRATSLMDKLRLTDLDDPSFGPKPAVGGRTVVARRVTIDPSALYPPGYGVAISDGTNTFNYEPSTREGETAEEVAKALVALVNANASYTATHEYGHWFKIEMSGGGEVPTFNADYQWSKAVSAFFPSLNLATNDLAGLTIENLTDGSSAPCLQNGASFIEANTFLTGGTFNEFREGDLIRVRYTNSVTFRRATWEDRTVGDETLNPFPGFLDKTIDSIFFVENRLGFTYGSSVALSASGSSGRFFRSTVRALVPSDPVDFTAALDLVPNFHAAIEWNESFWLWSDNGQMKLGGDPITASTVTLDLVTRYFSSDDVQPVVAGDRIIFVRPKNGYTEVLDYYIPPFKRTPSARTTTGNVPSYIEGNPVGLDADANLGFVAVHTDASPANRLYVLLFAIGNQEIFTQLAWSKWDLPEGSSILGIAILDGQLSVVSQRSDGAYLERITIEDPTTA